MADDPRTKLRLAGAQRVPSTRLELFIRRDFIGPAACAELIRLIDAGRRPSTLADDAGEEGFRTSESCDLSSGEPAVIAVYLNTPGAGGATRFKTIDRTIPPERGKLLCWNNLLPDGRPNGATLHQGMKVRRGVKYIITKWYRERPWPR